jgi:hypothetical protein
LLVWVVDAAAAWAYDSDVAAAVSEFVDEGLVGATELHVLFAVLGQILSWVLAGEFGNTVEIKKGATLLILGLVLRARLVPLRLHDE